jgi:hypothetical protein
MLMQEFNRTAQLTSPLSQINIPQILDLPNIPESLLELSTRSMRSIAGSNLNPRMVSLVEVGIDDCDTDEQLNLRTLLDNTGIQRLPIFPQKDTSPIVACDASSVKIGETDSGMIFAIRAVAVWRTYEKISFTRWGPLLFHIPNGEDESNRLKSEEARIFGGLTVRTLRALTRLRNYVERWVQEVLSGTMKNGILLIDGSLTAGTPDNPASRVNHILKAARANGSVVVALSKSTQLTVGGKNILGFSDDANIPHMIDITSIVEEEYPAYPVRFLGRVYVAKLASDGFLFRVDIDRDVNIDQGMHAMGRIAGADVTFHGYPETLRIAHIFSTFTANEILAIQRFVASNHQVTLQTKPNLRRSLFGPFGSNRYVA